MKKLILFFILIPLILVMINGCDNVINNEGYAEVTEIELFVLESFPVQVVVVAKGYLPNPCTKIKQITQSREGNNFVITIKTELSQEPCIQIISPFEETIHLDVYGLPAGTYNVEVNDIKDSFTLEIDNILTEVIF